MKPFSICLQAGDLCRLELAVLRHMCSSTWQICEAGKASLLTGCCSSCSNGTQCTNMHVLCLLYERRCVLPLYTSCCCAALQVSASHQAYHPFAEQAVKWLWDIVSEFDDNERRHFLKFFTGSDRAPIGGLGNLRCIIQRDGTDSNKLPTSHTCFNTLLLPSYRSRPHMAARLRLAILNSEGFGLE